MTRTNPVPARPDPAILDALRGIATSHLSDNLDRLSGVTGLRSYGAGKLVGTAFTVKCRPGDNLMIYQALSLIGSGHVLVIDAGGEVGHAVVGELLMLYAKSRGCAGFVVEGAVRDVAAFVRGAFPCYGRGNTHKGPYKSGPGHLNVPVSIGGQVVLPGDYVVGDEDGIVTFSAEQTPALIDLARRQAAKEETIKAKIAAGDAETWITGVLRDAGIV